MNAVCTLALLVTLGTTPQAEDNTNASTCRIFVLKKVGEDIQIKSMDLGTDPKTKTLVSDTESGIIDIILPVGPGGSGSLVQLSDGATMTVSCKGDQIQVVNHVKGGKTWERPARELKDLARYDVRVSVTGADDTRKAFLILQNEKVIADDVGPVMNMFAGRIPLGEGDYVVCTDTFLHDFGTHAEGDAPLEFSRYPLVKVRLPSGKEGTFIVDIGAGTTIVSQAFLPRDAAIEKASMVQYSASGKELLKYAPGGATGKVESILGHVKLSTLLVGGIVYKDVSVDVIKTLPDFFGRQVDGIIGLDLLRRTKILSFDLTGHGKASPKLSLHSDRTGRSEQTTEVPFSIVKSHIFVNGRVNDVPVYFILDTGAPNSLLDVPAAKAARVKGVSAEARTAKGLDGVGAEIRTGATSELTIGDKTIADTTFDVSALSAFAMLRTGGQRIGLLGNSFFAKFRRVDVDFERRVVRFVPK